MKEVIILGFFSNISESTTSLGTCVAGSGTVFFKENKAVSDFGLRDMSHTWCSTSRQTKCRSVTHLDYGYLEQNVKSMLFSVVNTMKVLPILTG